MKEFKGVVAAMVTPFNEDGSINLTQEKNLVNYFIEKGIHGILVSGGTGEASLMNLNERKQAIKTASDILKDTELFCVAGVSCASTSDSIELAKYSSDAGVDYILVQPPHGYPVTKEGILSYFKEIKENIECGMILYHFPDETGVEFSPEEIVEMSRSGLFQAIKNTTSMEHTMELILENGHNSSTKIVNGFDSLVLASLSCGSDGILTSGVNMVPAQFVEIYNLIQKNNLQQAAQIYEAILPLLNLQEIEGNTEPGICKYCLKLLGVDAGIPRKPIEPISESAKIAVENALRKMNSIF